MKITKFRPLDDDCHEMEEYTVDTQDGKSKFTGKRYRKVGIYIPSNSDDFKAFSLEMRKNNWIILYDPKTLKPYPYELVTKEQ